MEKLWNKDQLRAFMVKISPALTLLLHHAPWQTHLSQEGITRGSRSGGAADYRPCLDTGSLETNSTLNLGSDFNTLFINRLCPVENWSILSSLTNKVAGRLIDEDIVYHINFYCNKC